MNYLVYQAYGSPVVLQEALFSILSFLRVAPASAGTQILIYTDEPIFFQQVLGNDAAVTYETIPAAQWQQWRGEIDFVHRVKLKMLEHAAAHHPGNLLYIDSDTIFLQDPAPLFQQIEAGSPVVHISEGTMGHGNLLNRKIYRRLQGQQFTTGALQFAIPADTMMYNAGMVGFRSQDFRVITEVLAVTEALYRFYPKHVMEQLAFSLRLPTLGPVTEAAPYVLHYWNIKVEVRPLIDAFFAKYGGLSQAELAERTPRIDIAEAAQSKLRYYALAGWQRMIRKIIGRRWKMPQIDI